MIRVVLDTNVIVSAHLVSEGLEISVLNMCLAGRLRLYVSPEILAEYEMVLARPKLRIDPDRARESLRLITAAATLVKPTHRLSVCRDDPDDNRFLECAEAAGVDFLVTGNKRHFPQRWKTTQIVNARELTAHITPPSA